MSHQTIEEEVLNETMQNIHEIIQFLRSSRKYQCQIFLIKKLEGMYTKLERNAFFENRKTSSSRETTLALLKMAISYHENLETTDNPEFSRQNKITLINDCMEYLKFGIGSMVGDNFRQIASYLDSWERLNFTQALPKFFKNKWLVEDLLSAIFMGQEELATTIVDVYPALMFEVGTYEVPIDGVDGLKLEQSEQIYYNITPLELMLYTGDWKMWERIFPLIPEERDMEVLETLQVFQYGGSDLIRIDRDPRILSVHELLDGDLLHNRNGIFFYEFENQIEFYFVDIHPKTFEKEIKRLIEPQNMSLHDIGELEQFKQFIRHNIAMNSGLRTSDKQYSLVSRIFNINLERRGIQYVLNGVAYQDTKDGCTRLKNAYKRYGEIIDIRNLNTTYDELELAWLQTIGMSQRHSMVHIIQRFCEQNKPFYPLQDKDDLKLRDFIRTAQFDNWVTTNHNIFPLRSMSGLGFDFGLYKASCRWGMARGRKAMREFPLSDAASVRLIEEIRNICFKERLVALERKLYATPDHFLKCTS